ncbi:carboxypeptidase D [Culicoides brevitarsis]|uniref:carboxypeptidase D n=1 Tax=Culicoides brevitarsis TaxID=469753 RepID=UPI00307C044F
MKNLSIIFLMLVGVTVRDVWGASLANHEDERFLEDPHYTSNQDLGSKLLQLQNTFPSLAKLTSIGKSLEGRDLFVLEIRKNVQHTRPLLMPMFKYVANMHGDETVGRQLLIYLAEYLLYNYNSSSEVTSLVDNTAIFLMPSMNPDGFERSFEGNCDSLPQYVGRINAAGVDLNRDFPDRLDNLVVQKLKNQRRQPETIATIEWLLGNPFVLSANLHGGAVVASYPYDNSIKHRQCCENSLTPDDRVFKVLANTYAKNHPTMRRGLNCNESFPRGITNGAFWYELDGGMQDFNYAFTNCFEITLELSCCKFPKAEELVGEWKRNKRSLIEFMKLTHMGVKGLVTDARGHPLRDAEIVVENLEDKPVRSTERGEYWRLLTPGTYRIQATAFDYSPSEVYTVTVTEDGPVELNFQLYPVDYGRRIPLQM